jgi:citrate synthase
MSGEHPWIGAAAAAELLGVSRTTLYAYVSRGYLRSQVAPGSSRERNYARDDVERLKRRTEDRRAPDKAAARALHWGLPTLESSITLIDHERLYYRGHDVLELARSRSIAEIAALIWTGQFDAPFAKGSAGGPGSRPPDGPFISSAQSMLAAAAARDAGGMDTRAPSVAATGWRILMLLTRAITRADVRDVTIDAALGRAWKVNARGVPILRAALILSADHELNVSSFTARCVASAGSHPYAVVIAGLAALGGPKHGGASARVAAMLESMRKARSLRTTISDRLRRGESIEGFGHPLYPSGDPRARLLLHLLREQYATSPEYRFVSEFADTASAATREHVNLDFGLAAVARVLKLPPDAPLILFAIGRTIGWIGHAIEQYATGQLIRPRAKYVGVVPAAPAMNKSPR